MSQYVHVKTQYPVESASYIYGIYRLFVLVRNLTRSRVHSFVFYYVNNL